MGRQVKLADSLVETAIKDAEREHRSLPKQIEFRYKIAGILEQNPDLTYSMVRDILTALDEKPVGEYVFDKSLSTK
jgi:hypothetical protein